MTEAITGIRADRLEAELIWIREHPEGWLQGCWLDPIATDGGGCGSRGCLAGNGALHNGLTRTVETEFPFCGETIRSVEYRPLERFGVLAAEAEAAFADGGYVGEPWFFAGKEAFGLTNEQAEALFDGNNSLWRLWHLACLYTGGAIAVPEDLVPDRDCPGCGRLLQDGEDCGCCCDEDGEDG